MHKLVKENNRQRKKKKETPYSCKFCALIPHCNVFSDEFMKRFDVIANSIRDIVLSEPKDAQIDSTSQQPGES